MVGGSPLPPKICAHSDPPLSEKRQFRPVSAYNVSTLRASKKVQLSSVGSRPRAFQRAIDVVRTLPQLPQRVAQKVSLSFKNKFPYMSLTYEASDLDLACSWGLPKAIKNLTQRKKWAWPWAMGTPQNQVVPFQ